MKKILVMSMLSVTLAAQAPIYPGRARLDVLPGRPGGDALFDADADQHAERQEPDERAWTFHTGDDAGFFESTPMVIDSVMYFSARNGVYSIDAVTGELIWKHETTGTRPPRALRTGPAATVSHHASSPASAAGMIALDAKTGTLVSSFGKRRRAGRRRVLSTRPRRSTGTC